MRIFSVISLCLLFILHIQIGYAQASYSRINYKADNITIEKAINVIERQSEYLFIVNSSVDLKQRVSIHAKGTPILLLLNSLFRNTDIHYTVQGNYIILSKKKNNNVAVAKEVTPVKREIEISGVVSDVNGQPLAGVNVAWRGASTIGTISNANGHYTLRIPDYKGELRFSYIGYATLDREVNSQLINVTMWESNNIINEVVVTALGIERKAENLTYATQTVGQEELTRAKETNFVNSLQGKCAGLLITPNAGGAGGSSKLLLRGNSSILGNNTPLIVLDGVPMSNTSILHKQDNGSSLMVEGSSELSDNLSQLNPDDISSITILKGANSAALYGSAASNGVLMITTKRGSKGALKVDVSSSTMFESPLILPKIQSVYGGAISGSAKNGFTLGADSWGGKLDDMTAEQLNQSNSKVRMTNQAYNISDYFDTGASLNNSISLSGGTDKLQSYFSYGNIRSNGINPHSKFYRHNFYFRENFSFWNDRLKINIAGSYVKQKTIGRSTGGIYSDLANLYTASRNVDINYYKNHYSDPNGTWTTLPYPVYTKTEYPDRYNPYEWINVDELNLITTTLTGEKQIWYQQDVSGKNNPWWLINRTVKTVDDNHVFGNVGAFIRIFPELDLQLRTHYDYVESTAETRQYATTMRPSDMNERGRLLWRHDYNREFYGDFIFNYSHYFNADNHLSVNAGGSMMSSKTNYWSITPAASTGKLYQEDFSFNQFSLSDIYIHGGGVGNDVTDGGLPVENWECSMFFTAQYNYKDIITADGSYRLDWYRAFTQFPDLDRHFSYYSLGGNVELTRLFVFPELFNTVKLRTSYSEVGNSIPNSLFLSSATRNPTTGAYIMSGQTDFTSPRPETTTSFETGLSLSLFNKAFNLDLTYYHSTMKNQFMSYVGKGGKTVYTNSGKVRNQGLEVMASYIYSPTNDFEWKSGINFSYNSNKIISTAKKQDGTDLLREVDLGNGSGLKVKFLPGGSYGDLYANDYLYNADGSIKINPKTGAAFIEQGKASIKLGNMNANIHFGWNNTFIYKNVQLYFLFDGKIGGKIVSFTEAFLDYYGSSQRSADNRLEAEQNHLVWKNKWGDSYPGMYMNDGKMTSIQAYYTSTGGSTPLGQNYVYDATNVRLRECSLSYVFRNLFGISKHLTLSLIGRNLFFVYKKAPVDPDTSLTTQNALGNVDIFCLPSVRSYGFSLKATF